MTSIRGHRLYDDRSGLDPPVTNHTSTNAQSSDEEQTSLHPLWEAINSCGTWNTLLASYQESLCAPLHEQCLNNDASCTAPAAHSNKNSCNNFLDPHNFTIAHNDSMSTNATGDIDPDRIFAEQLSRVEDDRKMQDDSSISRSELRGRARRRARRVEATAVESG